MRDFYFRRKSHPKALCQGLAASGCTKHHNPYIIDVARGKEHLYEEIPAEDRVSQGNQQRDGVTKGNHRSADRVAKDNKQSAARDNEALENSQSSSSPDNSPGYQGNRDGNESRCHGDGKDANKNSNVENTRKEASENISSAPKEKTHKKKLPRNSHSALSQSQSRVGTQHNPRDSEQRINAKMKQYDLHSGSRDSHPGNREEICLEVQSFLPDRPQDSGIHT